MSKQNRLVRDESRDKVGRSKKDEDEKKKTLIGRTRIAIGSDRQGDKSTLNVSRAVEGAIADSDSSFHSRDYDSAVAEVGVNVAEERKSKAAEAKKDGKQNNAGKARTPAAMNGGDSRLEANDKRNERRQKEGSEEDEEMVQCGARTRHDEETQGRKPFTEEETEAVKEGYILYGKKWSQIVKLYPALSRRTGVQVKVGRVYGPICCDAVVCWFKYAHGEGSVVSLIGCGC
jgi:hypothetical protein